VIPIRASIIFLILALVIFSIFFLLRLDTVESFVDQTRSLMGTVVEIKVSTATPDERILARKAIEEAFKEIARVEGVFSIFRDDSEASRINRTAASRPVKTSDEVFELIERSIEYNKKTNGAYDITVRPLVILWQRARSSAQLPTDSELNDALFKVGSQWIVLDKTDKTVFFKKGGMLLDFGGVAKGYATDRVIQILKGMGIKNAIVNCGGDMYCLGRRSRKLFWTVGIRHPRDRNKICFKLKLSDRAIDTSGDYEKYFMLNGKRYSHIIDPRSGYPIGDDVVSATVIAPDATASDMLATALCVLGRDGLGTIKSMNGVDALIIMKKGNSFQVGMSGGLKERYSLVKEKGF
jgi:thiamine biosynthesis lipoprotein